MTTYAQIENIALAHYDRDERRFTAGLLQIAAHLKSEDQRKRLQSLTQKLQVVELPPNVRGFVHAPAPCSMDDLVLDAPIVAALEDIRREHSAREALALHNLKPRTRLLFTGPPGNGKTSAAAALAGSLGLTPYVATLPSMLESYLGSSSKNLAAVMGALSPSVALILDELDCIGGTRAAGGEGGNREYSTITNTLLTLFDRHDDGVIVATTNRAEALDPALVRRFDTVVEFPAPTDEQVGALTEALCRKYAIDRSQLEPTTNRLSFDAIAKSVAEQARRIVIAADVGKAAAE